MRTFAHERRRNLARLKRGNRALTKLEEYEAAQLMPGEIRPDVRKPLLGRRALASLREMLEGVLSEQEEMWGRRN